MSEFAWTAENSTPNCWITLTLVDDSPPQLWSLTAACGPRELVSNLHFTAGMTTDDKAEHAKHEVTKGPDRDDVHEQREKEQGAEGLVQKPVPPKKG